MMPTSSGASRLRRARLRVLPGGLHLPVEKIDPRVTEAHKAGALMRATLSVLTFALAMNVAAAFALYWQVEHSAQVALALATAAAVVTALGTGLVARARQRVRHIVQRNRQTGQGNEWDTSCSHTG